MPYAFNVRINLTSRQLLSLLIKACSIFFMPPALLTRSHYVVNIVSVCCKLEYDWLVERLDKQSNLHSKRLVRQTLHVISSRDI